MPAAQSNSFAPLRVGSRSPLIPRQPRRPDAAARSACVTANIREDWRRGARLSLRTFAKIGPGSH
jgi:hypothetical protein